MDTIIEKPSSPEYIEAVLKLSLATSLIEISEYRSGRLPWPLRDRSSFALPSLPCRLFVLRTWLFKGKGSTKGLDLRDLLLDTQDEGFHGTLGRGLAK
jgi:hypothetical protein